MIFIYLCVLVSFIGNQVIAALPSFISRDIAALHFMSLDNKNKYDYISSNIIGLKTETICPFGNRICSSLDIQKADILKVKKFFGKLPFKWWISEAQIKLDKILKEEGFSYNGSYAIMKLNINKFKSQEAFSYDIKVISSSEEKNIWINIVSTVDDLPFAEIEKFTNYAISNTLSHSIKLYLGLIDRVPVATGMAILHGDILTIHDICVLPQFRKRGLGTALTKKIISDFAEKVSTVYLIATSMASSLYKKIGFESYSKYHAYLYNKV